MKITNLLNDIFNIEQIEMNAINKKYFKLFIIIMVLLIIVLMSVKIDHYYVNSLIINEDNILLVVDKKMINELKNKTSLFVNDVSSNYSINRIISDGNICYIDINLETNILSNQNMQYKIILGKEKIIEYFIRVIKKV